GEAVDGAGGATPGGDQPHGALGETDAAVGVEDRGIAVQEQFGATAERHTTDRGHHGELRVQEGLEGFPADAEQVCRGVGIAVGGGLGQGGQVGTGAEGAGLVIADDQGPDTAGGTLPASHGYELEGLPGTGVQGGGQVEECDTVLQERDGSALSGEDDRALFLQLCCGEHALACPGGNRFAVGGEGGAGCGIEATAVNRGGEQGWNAIGALGLQQLPEGVQPDVIGQRERALLPAVTQLHGQVDLLHGSGDLRGGVAAV